MEKPRINVLNIVGDDTTSLQADAIRTLAEGIGAVAPRVLHVGDGPIQPFGGGDVKRIRSRMGMGRFCPRGPENSLTAGGATVLHVWSLRALSWIAIGVQRLARSAPARIPPIVLELDSPDRLRGQIDAFRLLNVLARITIIAPKADHSPRWRGLDVRPEQLAAIPTGVDPARFRATEREPLRTRLGLRPGQIGVLPLPPIARASGAFVAAWGALLLEHARPGVRVLLTQRGRETDRITNLVHACRLDSMLAPASYGIDLPELLAAADLAVFLPHRAVTLAGLHWAMASGCPLIVSDTVGMRRLFTPYGGAWFCPPNSPKEACRAMLAALENEPQSRRQTDAAKAQANAAFGRRRMLEAYCRIYEALLGPAGVATGFEITLVD